MLKSDPKTWTDARHRQGAAAEELAANLLRREGYHIVEQRFRFHRHDVDLVARKGSVVVFVEVKSRHSDRYGAAVEAIGWRKQRELVRAASSWLQRFGRHGDVCRFDVVTVQGGRVEWLQAAFRPLWR
ncbi:MAG: YraN family protein [Gemmatimonadales bacterium]